MVKCDYTNSLVLLPYSNSECTLYMLMNPGDISIETLIVALNLV